MRRVRVALVLLAVSAPVFGTGFARAEAPAGDVRGGAQSIAMRLVPYVGVPGISAALGITTAQVEADMAAASAAAADLGLAGTLINASAPTEEGKEPPFQLPEPINATSGRTEKVERYPMNPGAPGPDGAQVGSGAHEVATATEDPLASVGSVTGPELNIPGVLRITGGLSRATADKARAVGEVTLGQLVLGENAVILSGMTWRAVKAPGKVAEQSFTLGSMTVSGQTMPTGSDEELAAAFKAANTALEPTGLSLGVPQVVGTASEASVAPLVLQFRSPESLVEPGAQVSAVTKPILLETAKAILAAYPDAAAAQIVVNALVGATSGRSGGRLEFGGVSARADLLPAVDDEVAPTVVPPTTPIVPDVPSGTPTLPTEAGTVPAIPSNSGVTDIGVTKDDIKLGSINMHGAALGAQPTTSSETLGGRGHAAIALGVGLLLLIALALADRLRAA